MSKTESLSEAFKSIGDEPMTLGPDGPNIPTHKELESIFFSDENVEPLLKNLPFNVPVVVRHELVDGDVIGWSADGDFVLSTSKEDHDRLCDCMLGALEWPSP